MSDQPYRIAIGLILVAIFFVGESMAKVSPGWGRTGVIIMILLPAIIVALICAERIKP